MFYGKIMDVLTPMYDRYAVIRYYYNVAYMEICAIALTPALEKIVGHTHIECEKME